MQRIIINLFSLNAFFTFMHFVSFVAAAEGKAEKSYCN